MGLPDVGATGLQRVLVALLVGHAIVGATGLRAEPTPALSVDHADATPRGRRVPLGRLHWLRLAPHTERRCHAACFRILRRVFWHFQQRVR